MSEERNTAEFLRRRWASAIQSGDDRTALRLRLQLDRMLNGRLAQASVRAVPNSGRPVGARRDGPDLLSGIWGAAASGSRGARPDLLALVDEEVADRIA